jgi:hypothetical protein
MRLFQTFGGCLWGVLNDNDCVDFLGNEVFNRGNLFRSSSLSYDIQDLPAGIGTERFEYLECRFVIVIGGVHVITDNFAFAGICRVGGGGREIHGSQHSEASCQYQARTFYYAAPLLMVFVHLSWFIW